MLEVLLRQAQNAGVDDQAHVAAPVGDSGGLEEVGDLVRGEVADFDEGVHRIEVLQDDVRLHPDHVRLGLHLQYFTTRAGAMTAKTAEGGNQGAPGLMILKSSKWMARAIVAPAPISVTNEIMSAVEETFTSLGRRMKLMMRSRMASGALATIAIAAHRGTGSKCVTWLRRIASEPMTPQKTPRRRRPRPSSRARSRTALSANFWYSFL